MRCYLEADAPRVACPVHGAVVAAVPWARSGSRFTAAFEDQAAWLCAAMNTTKAAELLRTTWRSLQAIIGRVVADLAGKTDRLAGLRRIGIDELSYRKVICRAWTDVRHVHLLCSRARNPRGGTGYLWRCPRRGGTDGVTAARIVLGAGCPYAGPADRAGTALPAYARSGRPA